MTSQFHFIGYETPHSPRPQREKKKKKKNMTYAELRWYKNITEGGEEKEKNACIIQLYLI